MSRLSASVPPEAIRIEDEVWQEAFARREPGKPRRLHAIEGGRPTRLPAPAGPAVTGTSRSAAAPSVRPDRPRTAARPVEPLSAAESQALRPPGLGNWQDGPSSNAVGGVPGRRTVTIRGHGAERNLPWPDASRRRPQRRAYERAGFRPDRVAMWAVLLGVLLVVVAVASAHG